MFLCSNFTVCKAQGVSNRSFATLGCRAHVHMKALGNSQTDIEFRAGLYFRLQTIFTEARFNYTEASFCCTEQVKSKIRPVLLMSRTFKPIFLNTDLVQCIISSKKASCKRNEQCRV